MAKLSTRPVDAVIGTLINDFSKTVFNGGLTSGVNIIHGNEYRNFRMNNKTNTAFFDVGEVGEGIIRNRGPYSHFFVRYPVVIYVHSYRSDEEAIAWIEEAWEIMQDRRLTIVNLYPDYRKIFIESGPQDISTGTKYKYKLVVELETNIKTFN